MIAGIGVDIIEIARIAKAVKNPHFNERVYTPEELTETHQASHRLAGFFAAKEALLKAMGTGLAGFNWLEMAVLHDSQGAPYFQVNGKIRDFLRQHQIARVHLSISHCREYAVAEVILEEGELDEGGFSRTDAAN